MRFINTPKYVNPNVAMELIAKVPPIASKDRVVWCDGGDEFLGHPKVYINLVSLLVMILQILIFQLNFIM